jgi:hypothetical protein
MRCIGVNSSPILFLPCSRMLRGGCHPLLSHNCIPAIDTLLRTRQMWAERYILVSEGNREQMLDKAGY